jgi:hypothetical protein
MKTKLSTIINVIFVISVRIVLVFALIFLLLYGLYLLLDLALN